MRRQSGRGPKQDIRGEADIARNALRCQTRHQIGILRCSDTVRDAVRMKDVEGGTDAFRAADLARVRHDEQSSIPRERAGRSVVRHHPGELIARKPKGYHPISSKIGGPARQLQRLFPTRAVAWETHEHANLDAEPPPRCLERVVFEREDLLPRAKGWHPAADHRHRLDIEDSVTRLIFHKFPAHALQVIRAGNRTAERLTTPEEGRERVEVPEAIQRDALSRGQLREGGPAEDVLKVDVKVRLRQGAKPFADGGGNWRCVHPEHFVTPF